MPEKRKGVPSGEWLGYPELSLEDIEYDCLRSAKYIAQSIVDNRKARITLRMEHSFYQHFLEAVRKKYGSISSRGIEKAAREAVKTWIKEVLSR